MKKIFNWIIWSYLITVIASICLFWYKESMFKFQSPINYELFGYFGNFIGGLVGTLLSVLTIFFLYKAFTVQVAQADLSKEVYKLDVINRIYTEIISEINGLEYKEFKGINALYKFDDEHRTNPNSIMNHLCLIFTLSKNAIKLIGQSQFVDKSIEKIELEKFYLLFYSKLIWPVYQNIYDKLYDDIPNIQNIKFVKGLKRHNDAEIIFDKYRELTADTYDFLLKENLVTLPTTKQKMLDIINRNVQLDEQKH